MMFVRRAVCPFESESASQVGDGNAEFFYLFAHRFGVGCLLDDSSHFLNMASK